MVENLGPEILRTEFNKKFYYRNEYKRRSMFRWKITQKLYNAKLSNRIVKGSIFILSARVKEDDS